jgi:hypothetical protein
MDMTDIIHIEEARRLRDMAMCLMRGSTLAPGAAIARGTNKTGHSLLLPGVNTAERSCYPAFWTRDPAWLAAGGLASFDEAWGWLQLLCKTMSGPQPRRLASGAELPPFSVADHVNLDGRPVYFPGTYDSGENQGGPQWGLLPPHDDQYWVTFTAHACRQLSGDAAFGARLLATPLGEIPVWLACDLTHHAFAVEPSTGCCLVEPGRHQVDWGYNDSIIKDGQVLFPSLLRSESALKLAELLDGCGQSGRASQMRGEAETLRRGIVATFLKETDGESWLLSATGVGRIPDVWGTAFAVHRRFFDAALTEKLARSLLLAYRDGESILQGQVSHVLRRDGAWPQAHSKPGTYQNGAYWGYATGWYVSALSQVDRQAARDLVVDYLAAMEQGWSDDGSKCAWECINPALDHYKNQGYLTTVALPYVVLQEAGLCPS